VTKENMEQTIVKDAFHGHDEVYRGASDSAQPKSP
jgi:hypothetical protein